MVIESIEIDGRPLERVDIYALIPRPPGCDERGCRYAYMERWAGDLIWEFAHANTKVYGRSNVMAELVDDEVAWKAFIPHMIEEVHETMDHWQRKLSDATP